MITSVQKSIAMDQDKENDHVKSRYQSFQQFHTLWKILSSDPSVQAEMQSFRPHSNQIAKNDNQDRTEVPQTDFISAIQNKTNVAFQVHRCEAIDCIGCVDPILEDDDIAEEGTEFPRRDTTPQRQTWSRSFSSSPVSSSCSGGNTVVAFDISHLSIHDESDQEGGILEETKGSECYSATKNQKGSDLGFDLSQLTIHLSTDEAIKNDSPKFSPVCSPITDNSQRKQSMHDVKKSPVFSEDGSLYSSSSGGSTVIKFVMDSKSLLQSDNSNTDMIPQEQMHLFSPTDDTENNRMKQNDDNRNVSYSKVDISDSEAEWAESEHSLEYENELNNEQENTIIILDDDDLIEYESDVSTEDPRANIIDLDDDSDVCTQDDSEPTFGNNKISYICKISSIHEKTEFKRNKEKITLNTKKWFDEKVFGGNLHSVEVTYAPRLTSTAGLTRLKTRTVNGVKSRMASIELSSKLIDDEDRLKSTLMHELCHAAAFLVDGVSKPPHGECFKKWSKHAMKIIPEIIVTTKHSYSTNTHKYAWACSNKDCPVVIKRHSRSVKVEKHVCGKCKNKLIEIQVPKPDSSSFNVPRKKKQATGFSLYVQQNSSTVRKKLEANCKGRTVEQKDVMKELGVMWRALKLTGNIKKS